MNRKSILDFIRKYDFSFFGITSAIFIVGIANLYSATHASVEASMASLYKAQIFWFFISIIVGIMVSFFNPKSFFRYSILFYTGAVILLIMVLLLGHVGMGAQRWIAIGPIKFQPSEPCKLALVLMLSRWFTKHDIEKELGFKEIIIPFLLAFIPAIMVIVQPDLGTGMLLLLIFFFMAFYRKLKWKTIGVVAILGVFSGLLMYNFGLKEYQKKRVITFLDPDIDAKGSGYNAIQSKIAIGSGQFFGKGFMNSSQASLNYLPENHTDFVFAIFNEEHGFFGSLFLIGLYLILFYRFIWLATSVVRIFDSLVVVGIMSIFFWHTFFNMGMVMGLLPIVGIPLPLMSYGGSSLLTFGVCCGIATSISNSRNLF